jgi:hypothetical protein
MSIAQLHNYPLRRIRLNEIAIEFIVAVVAFADRGLTAAATAIRVQRHAPA